MSKSEDSSLTNKKSSCTIMTEIQRLEDSLKESVYRVEVIERKLQTKLLTMETREKLERELELVKDVLQSNEDHLHGLRRQNTKSFMVAAALVFAIFLIYGVYCLIFNIG